MSTPHDEPHVHGPHCNHDHGPKEAPAQRVERPGRNDPCWCGSEKKYKKCHAAADEAATTPHRAD